MIPVTAELLRHPAAQHPLDTSGHRAQEPAIRAETLAQHRLGFARQRTMRLQEAAIMLAQKGLLMVNMIRIMQVLC